VEKRGPIAFSSEPCKVVTNKTVQTLHGDRIWLVSGEARPRTYSLRGSFVVAEIQQDSSETERYQVWGSTERWFKAPIRIDTHSWFESLKRVTGNFAFGLQRIKNPDITRGLLDVSLDHTDSATAGNSVQSSGGLFGTPEANRLVEMGAVNAVTAEYRANGWAVVSHEDRKYGYDLHCTRSQTTLHVEVKGVKGRDCSFILTANEREFSTERASFRLCVVTSALDAKHREIHTFTAAELASKFDFEPLAFSARLKK
jgi:hypothetical protein